MLLHMLLQTIYIKMFATLGFHSAMKVIPLWRDSIYLEKFMEVEPPAPELPILWLGKSIKPGPRGSPDLSKRRQDYKEKY